MHILSGHSYDRPLGDLKSGSARITSTREAVQFEVDLPPDAAQPTYMQDAVKQVRANLAGGISPGFRVPLASAVANAETFEPATRQRLRPNVDVVARTQVVLVIGCSTSDLDT